MSFLDKFLDMDERSLIEKPENWQYYHETFQLVKAELDSPYSRELSAKIYLRVGDYFHENASGGIVDLEKATDDEITHLSDIIIDAFKEFYIEKYPMAYEHLRGVRSLRHTDMLTQFDHLIQTQMNGIDYDTLFMNLREFGEMRADNLYRNFVNTIYSAHIQHVVSSILKRRLPTKRIEHLHRGTAYLHMAIKHNPRTLRDVGKVNYPSFEAFKNGFMTIAQRLHHTYNPENPDTFI